MIPIGNVYIDIAGFIGIAIKIAITAGFIIILAAAIKYLKDKKQ